MRSATPSPPAAAISSPVSSIVSGRPTSEGPATRLVRPVAYTAAPARASSTAIARPAPRVAPATSATLPVSGLFSPAAITAQSCQLQAVGDRYAWRPAWPSCANSDAAPEGRLLAKAIHVLQSRENDG